MRVCIFYSWQSDYEDDCKRFIGRALNNAVKELNTEQQVFEYYVVRGGGGLVGSQEINAQINDALKYEACIVVSDFTHVGALPTKDGEGKWMMRRALPNPNVIDETARAKERVGTMQVIKVNNSFYGEYGTNIEMFFDIQNERFPLGYNYHKDGEQDTEEQKEVFNKLKKALKKSIGECTVEFLKNQKIRFSPLIPLMDVFKEKMFSEPFLPAGAFQSIKGLIDSGKSFRVLALPGIGKTRMVCEAFRGVDMNLYYCDCKNKNIGSIKESIGKLLDSTKDRQTIVVDNCEQGAHTLFLEEIQNHDTACQLITLFYNVRELDDSGVEVVRISPKETPDVVNFLLENVEGLKDEDKSAIIEIAGGFPLMVNLLIEQYKETGKIASVSRAELFNRMLNINEANADDVEKKKVMTAFSIFKFIGMYEREAEQGKFIANNQTLTPLSIENKEARFLRFQNVCGEYTKGDILDREGNLVLMRPVPLAIFLARKWYQQQTAETISSLVAQINAIQDEGTKNMLVESLSRRINLMADVPLAQDLIAQLLSPVSGPFLSEEVVMTKLGSRLFLAFSEVNPEACALALWTIVKKKSDSELIALEEARRNLAWALDHLAFDRRSFKNAMFSLARFSLVETEGWLSNNTTGLFVERFPVILPATETPIMERLDVITELLKDERYIPICRKALLMGLNINHEFRSGGAEKQGLKRLSDYIPKTYGEVLDYLRACFNILLSLVREDSDYKEIGSTIETCARGYYLRGFESFLFEAIEELGPKYDYDWEGMKRALGFILKYDVAKRRNFRADEVRELRSRFVKDDYVYRLHHVNDELDDDRLSFEEGYKKKAELYEAFARELIDGDLYYDPSIMKGIVSGNCFYYNTYGPALSSYSKEQGKQEALLNVVLDYVLSEQASKDGESLFIYFMLNVDDGKLVDSVYSRILKSDKKRLLPALFAIKAEGEEKLAILFGLLEKGDLVLKDFSGYFNYLSLRNFDIKYVAGRLLDYGPEAAELVLMHCHNLLFGDNELDAEYDEIGRRCLLQMNLQGIQMDDFVFLQSMNKYLIKNHDEEMAWHVQKLQEKAFEEHSYRDNFYLGRLYRKVLKRYKDLLKPRLFELLEKEDVRHSWFELMKTSYPQEEDEQRPVYTIISSDEWFEWLDGGSKNDRKYALAMFFQYSNGDEVNPDMLRLIDDYWCFEVKDALGSRLHSFSWTGSGIPLYRSRIALCNDYIAKLKNAEAKEWFSQDIERWEKEIAQERLQNAHERALYE